jgi:hypothetical protein
MELSQVSIIDVARALGLDVREGREGEAWIACPAANHTNDAAEPRCGLNEEKGVFHCLKCGAKGDAVSLVKAVRDVSAGEAFKWLRETFGLAERERRPKYANALERLAGLRKWSVEALRAMGAVDVKYEVHFPQRDRNGEIVRWRRRKGSNEPYTWEKDGKTFKCKALNVDGGSRNGIFCAWPLPDGNVLLVEGETKVAAALTAGARCVVGTPGCSPGRVVEEELQQLLAGRKVTMAPDPDQAGNKWRARIGRNLQSVGCKVLVIPPIAEKDLDDRLRVAKDQRAELARLANNAIELDRIGDFVPEAGEGGEAGEAEPEANGGDAGGGVGNGGAGGRAGRGGEPGKRAEIRIGPDEARVCDEIIGVFVKQADYLYQRSGKLVTTVNAASDEERNISRFGGLSIVVVNNAWVRNTVTRHCRLVEYNPKKEDWYWTHPPQWLGSALVSLREWPGVNELFGVASYPVLTSAGVVTENTYDPGSGWLINPLVKPAGFVARPGEQDLARAREVLHEVVRDFPFAHVAGESAWLSFLLTILARPSINGPAPLFLADASVRGSGKTLLITVGGIIAIGASPSIVPPTDDNEEERKRVYSLLMAGDAAVLFDNVTKIGGTTLDALLTNYPLWTDRILGASEAPKVPNLTVWSATANNPAIHGDARRRILPIRLEPREERPEARTGFAHGNLLEWVAERQAELLGAALILLAGWHAAGRPDQGLVPWGSYEAWTQVVRNCLVWAGYPDPAECRDELIVVADPDIAHLGALLDLLAQHGRPIKANEIVAKITAGEWIGEEADAIKEVASASNGTLSARVLAKRLERWRGRVAGGKRLETRPGAGGFMLYFADELDFEHGKQSHSQSLLVRQSDFVTSSDFVPSSLTRDHARADVGVCGLPEQSHSQSRSHFDAARALRDRLLARGVVLRLEEGRLIVLGSADESEGKEISRLHDALKALLDQEARSQGDLPF